MNISKNDVKFKVYKSSIRNFFDNIKYIEIPLYQRGYEWDREQVETLLEDIKARKDDSNEHYFGIIAKSKKNEKKDLIEVNKHRIIDGQQRITTAIILIHYLSKKIYNLNFESDGGFSEEFENISFRNEINTSVSEEISKIVSREYKSFSMKSGSKVEKIYKIIDNFFATNQKSSVFFENFLSTFLDKFIFAILEYDIQPSDEMLIFENLNSKGAPLSDYDLIKNILISYFDQFKAKENFQKLNGKVLNLLNTDQYKNKEISTNKIFENFIEVYLIWKNPNKRIEQFKSYKLYKNLKIYLEKNKDTLSFDWLIDDLRKYLNLYLSITYPINKNDIGFNLWFRVIKQKNVHMPFIFEIFKKYSNFEKDEWEINSKIIDYMKVLASHIIKYVSVHGSDQNFDSLILWMINWVKKDNNQPLEIQKKLKHESFTVSTTPTDSQFIESCYREQKNNKWISWSIIDMIDSLSENNNQNIEMLKERTKEYIMPKKPNEEAWQFLKNTDKSINKQKIHNHQIGNLLFLNKLKKEISGDKSFIEKKNQYYSLSNSCLVTSKGLENFKVKPLLQYSCWGFEEIKERTKFLAQVALNIMNNFVND